MDKNTNSNLPVIQSLWIGDELSTMERLSILSFLQNGHSFHLYTYDFVKNVPKGTVIRDASEVVSPDRIFKYKKRDSYAGFANLFRYKLLLERGNYWVDLDIICLKPFHFSHDYIFSGTIKRKLTYPFKMTSHIQNCLIKTPMGSEVMSYCYEIASKKKPGDLEWGETGPDLLEPAVIKFGLGDFVMYRTFSPVSWQDWRKFISSSLLVSWMERAKLAMYRSHSIHLYNEMWRYNGIDKDSVFPRNCIYELLKRRYMK